MKIKLFIIAIFTVGAFFLAPSVKAECNQACLEACGLLVGTGCEAVCCSSECEPGATACGLASVSEEYKCNYFTVYRCENNFCGKDGGGMLTGQQYYMCVDQYYNCANNCTAWQSVQSVQLPGGPYGPDDIQPYGEVPEYRICPPSYNSWGTTPPVPECSGSCYPAPNLKTLDDDGLLPANVADDSKYKLPINFGWEDNVEKEVGLPNSFCPVDSYVFNVAEPSVSLVINDTQVQRVEDTDYKLECQLKSGNSYFWQVQACVDANGADCGEWSSQQTFDTSLSPELISPYDSDWLGENKEEDVEVPITLDWCDVEEAEEYELRIYLVEDEEESCHPWLQEETECQPLSIIPEKTTGELISGFIDDQGYFAKDTDYRWEVATYFLKQGEIITDFSQEWDFAATGEVSSFFGLLYPVNDPTGETPVGLPVILSWSVKPGINSAIYEITPLDGGALINDYTTASEVGLDYPQLSLDSFYKWKVWPCSDYQGEKCEEEYAGEWYFKTTGRAPDLTSPSFGANNVAIPIELDWQDVPGAKSYVVKIQGEGLSLEKTVDESELSLKYPDANLHQRTNYSWQVKTCAKKDGQLCGSYSNLWNFTTFSLPPPTGTFPKNNGTLFTNENNVAWENVGGANAYQYKMSYISPTGEANETCSSLVGQEVVPLKTVTAQGDPLSLVCLGQYQWQVRSCLDSACQETGDWSSLLSFSFLEPSQAKSGGGLVPCGRITDNPDTRWNERETCQTRHFFLLFKIIFDFLLLRAVPAIAVVMVLATALMFYFSISTDSPDPIIKAKRLWRSFFIGLAIILFSWTIINIFLKLVGYQIGIFGNWYNL